MISDETRNKLRDSAIKNKLGYYKIYNRQSMTVTEIDELIEKYKSLTKYSDLFVFNKIYKNEKTWRNSIIRKLDNRSCNLFFFKLEQNIPRCKYCNKELSLDEYLYNRTNRFKKYCISCSNNGNFRRYKHSLESIVKFKKSKSKWVQSEKGKKFYATLGKSNSIRLKKFFNTDDGKKQIRNSAKKQSKILKEKIKNGKFTPNITNSWTHWNATVIIGDKKYKFRSSWEASFFVCNKNYKYETLRIPYIDGKGESRTYVGDFYDTENKVLYEIKPRSVFKKQHIKINGAIQYCQKNDIKFIWINEKNILNYVDKNMFSEYNLKQYNKMLQGIYGKNKN